MNILQQIWTDSNVISIFLVNLVHAVALVPVIDHDMVAVGETAQFFYRRIRKLRSDCRSLRMRFDRGRLKNRNLMLTAHILLRN